MHTIKELRLKFLSISVVITLTTLIFFQLALYFHNKGIILLPEALKAITSTITLVIATIFISSLILRFTIKRVANIFEEAEERIFYTKIYSWSVYSIGTFIILHHFGVSLGNITIFLGLLTTGLAFAVRDVLLSFFGWMILLRKKPFHIGDYIKIGDEEGRVLHIGTFYVHLDNTRDLPEDYTRVPNRLFLEKSVSILGKENLHDQIRFRLGEKPVDNKILEQELLERLKGLPNLGERLKAYLDFKDDKLYLVVEYTTRFENRQTARSEVIEMVFDQFKTFVLIPKACNSN